MPIGPIPDWFGLLQDPGSSGTVKLVLAQRREETRIKSATIIGRELRRKFRVDSNFIIEPWQIPHFISQGTEVFIFIDDFLGTGTQFEELCTYECLDGIFSSAYFIYAPLVAHETGVNHLRSQFPFLKVVAAELLDSNSGFFNPESNSFDNQISSEAAKKFYHEMLTRKGFDLSGPERRGFGSLELCYAFEHAAPDNSLPILWWNETPTWKPLFDR